MAFWPIGVPIWYAGILWHIRGDVGRKAAKRRAQRRGSVGGVVHRVSRERTAGAPRSALAHAAVFLYDDYREAFFWWEPLEMMRKLTVTGFILLVPQARLGPREPRLRPSLTSTGVMRARRRATSSCAA